MLKWHSVENANHGVIKQEIILSVRIYPVLLDRREDQSLSFDLFSYKDANKEQASMPVFYGQHASSPWVQVLKELISLDYPLN